ncbi:hypothetical protein CANCADRAFT_29968 [Tortispora caseinolytica NRRL Y-17796]|uniref:Uncharacterized protein n=1 Tax=Tortispora caseinolytica NRRL Y-17796 TaxID=767744 RepID=A0A1E4TIS2_9ASCO|nr:hypothetical protein CANCADRAFT_29968 [Tortispora caseinolytica NRRL Y-17796]
MHSFFLLFPALAAAASTYGAESHAKSAADASAEVAKGLRSAGASKNPTAASASGSASTSDFVIIDMMGARFMSAGNLTGSEAFAPATGSNGECTISINGQALEVIRRTVELTELVGHNVSLLQIPREIDSRTLDWSEECFSTAQIVSPIAKQSPAHQEAKPHAAGTKEAAKPMPNKKPEVKSAAKLENKPEPKGAEAPQPQQNFNEQGKPQAAGNSNIPAVSDSRKQSDSHADANAHADAHAAAHATAQSSDNRRPFSRPGAAGLEGHNSGAISGHSDVHGVPQSNNNGRPEFAGTERPGFNRVENSASAKAEAHAEAKAHAAASAQQGQGKAEAYAKASAAANAKANDDASASGSNARPQGRPSFPVHQSGSGSSRGSAKSNTNANSNGKPVQFGQGSQEKAHAQASGNAHASGNGKAQTNANANANAQAQAQRKSDNHAGQGFRQQGQAEAQRAREAAISQQAREAAFAQQKARSQAQAQAKAEQERLAHAQAQQSANQRACQGCGRMGCNGNGCGQGQCQGCGQAGCTGCNQRQTTYVIPGNYGQNQNRGCNYGCRGPCKH